MNVGKYSGAIAAYGSAAGRVSSGIASARQGAVEASNAVSALDGSPAVINSVNQSVYSAVDDFLYLSGDERLNSYNELSNSEKRKFMKVMGRLVESGSVEPSKLDLGEASPAKSAFLSEYAAFTDTTSSAYDQSGKIAS